MFSASWRSLKVVWDAEVRVLFHVILGGSSLPFSQRTLFIFSKGSKSLLLFNNYKAVASLF